MSLCAANCGRNAKHRFCTRKCAALYGAIQSRKGKTTDIERKVEEFLQQEKIAYEKDKAVARTSVPDFIVGNILIYCDGNRWHDTKKAKYRDNKINDKLRKLNYTVLRFSGSTIKSDFNEVVNTINKTILCHQCPNPNNVSLAPSTPIKKEK